MDKNDKLDNKLALGRGVVVLLGGAIAIAVNSSKENTTTPTVTYLSGIVTDSITGLPLSDVSLYNGNELLATTDSYGTYKITVAQSVELPVSMTVSFSKIGYTEVDKVVNIVAGKNTLNETMVQTTGTLSGVITDSVTGIPISGVTVVIGSTSTTTDSNGAYSIAGIPIGSYAVTFTKAGYTTISV